MGIVSKDIRSMDEETTTNSRQQSLAMCKGVNSKATNAAQVRSCAQTKGLRFCRRPFRLVRISHYVGGCRPREVSHSVRCEAVSARLARSNKSSRSRLGGSVLARSRSASA